MLQGGYSTELYLCVLGEPAVRNLLYRDGIEKVLLIASLELAHHQSRLFQDAQVFRQGLTGKRDMSSQFGDGLSVLLEQHIEHATPISICQRLEYLFHVLIHGKEYMQPFGCISIPKSLLPCPYA